MAVRFDENLLSLWSADFIIIKVIYKGMTEQLLLMSGEVAVQTVCCFGMLFDNCLVDNKNMLMIKI